MGEDAGDGLGRDARVAEVDEAGGAEAVEEGVCGVLFGGWGVGVEEGGEIDELGGVRILCCSDGGAGGGVLG